MHKDGGCKLSQYPEFKQMKQPYIINTPTQVIF